MKLSNVIQRGVWIFSCCAISLLVSIPVCRADDGFMKDASSGCAVFKPNLKIGEVVVWKGQCARGYAQGSGIAKWSANDGTTVIFEGTFTEGKLQGKGKMTASGGDRYDGDYRNGKREGHGVYLSANGDRYEGEYKDNQRAGPKTTQGTMLLGNRMEPTKNVDQSQRSNPVPAGNVNSSVLSSSSTDYRWQVLKLGWRLSPRGLGAIALGTSFQEVVKRSGVAFKQYRIEDSNMIDYALKRDPGALNVSVCPTGPVRGQIIAIQFYGDWVVTDRGIHIHDSVEKLVQAYGPLLKPVDAGQYAEFSAYYRHDDPEDPRYSVHFTVSRTDPNRNRVTEISASVKDSGCESW